MKKLLVFVALMLIPMTAFAGMTAITEGEMGSVNGQAGIDLSMSGTTISMTGFAWSDTDGYGAATNATGSLVLSGLTLPTLAFTQLTIDAGTNGGTSVLRLDFGGGSVMTGAMSVDDVVIGSASNATTASLGSINVTGLNVTVGVIEVSGH